MATIEVVNYCNNTLLKGWKRFNHKPNKIEPSTVDLAFFGIDSKVQEAELERMSETEKERHIQQDLFLLGVYGYAETKSVGTLRAEIITKARRFNTVPKVKAKRFQILHFLNGLNFFIEKNHKSIHITNF